MTLRTNLASEASLLEDLEQPAPKLDNGASNTYAACCSSMPTAAMLRTSLKPFLVLPHEPCSAS